MNLNLRTIKTINAPDMRKFFSIFLIIIIIFMQADTAYSGKLVLSKSSNHFMTEVEHYYEKPKPKMLKSLLQTFARENYLDTPEKQMAIGAFFGELLNLKVITPAWFNTVAIKPDKDMRRMLAWAFHFAKKKYDYLENSDKILENHIRNLPNDLLKWNIEQEPSVVDMYWLAYMAGGRTEFVDKIIRTALGCYPHAAVSDNPNFQAASSHAAATLYDFAPNHPSVQKRLIYFLSRVNNPAQTDILETIIKHSDGSGK